MAVTRRYQMLEACTLLLSAVEHRVVQYWQSCPGIMLLIATCTDLFSSSGPEGYIYMRANNSIKWVNEWGVNHGQVGSGYVPVANRLSHIACCVLAGRYSQWLR